MILVGFFFADCRTRLPLSLITDGPNILNEMLASSIVNLHPLIAPDSYDSIGLLGLIEKYVLKQTESHYPYLAVQEELRSMLNFAQGDDMTLGTYYEKFTTRMAIAERAGCSFVT